MHEKANQIDIKKLTRLAMDLGAHDAKAVSSSDIQVDESLASLCREPGCPCYGQSASCPPYVGGPNAFLEMAEAMDRAVVFKLDVPSEALLSSERGDIMGLLHEIAAKVEQTALSQGAEKAQGFAGGGCKELFCSEHAGCRVVDEGGPCRNPGLARPSMSGFGVNVGKLMETAGWPMWLVQDESNPHGESLGTVVGLVLVG
jgi:predicted metal-binding protein